MSGVGGRGTGGASGCGAGWGCGSGLGGGSGVASAEGEEGLPGDCGSTLVFLRVSCTLLTSDGPPCTPTITKLKGEPFSKSASTPGAGPGPRATTTGSG